MSKGIFQIPYPENEPIYDYAPGTTERKALEKAFNDPLNSKKDRSRILYRMLSVELWFREFIDK